MTVAGYENSIGKKVKSKNKFLKSEDILFIILLSVSLIMFSCSNKEIVRLNNPINKERIYLIKYTWSSNGNRIAISLNKELDAWKNYDDKFIIDCDSYLLYGFFGDTLRIYSCGSELKEPKNNNFQTVIVAQELDNYEFVRLLRDYKYRQKGLSFFPPSDYYIVNNRNEK